MSKRINPDMLIIARESRGLTQKELARQLSVSQGRLSKLENELLDNVPDVLLKKLSDVLDYPEKFFFLKEERYGLGMQMIYHRKRKCITSSVLGKIEAQTDIFRIHILRLLRSFEPKKDKMFQADIEEYHGDIGEIAQAVRAAWLLPRGPIKNLTNAIENAGGIVIWCDFETRKLDAISQWIPGMPPLFFINLNIPGDRLRFSLAHELGHIIMHNIPNPNMEKEANRFAGELLMPRQEISPYLNSLTLHKLAQLKLHWKVSMGALISRAKDLGKITERQTSYLWAQMSMAGYRTREPVELDMPREKPHVLRQIIDAYRNKLNYSTQDLCQLLAINPHQFHSMYFQETAKPQLYAIK